MPRGRRRSRARGCSGRCWSRRCSARGALKTRSAAGSGLPATSPSRPRGLAQPRQPPADRALGACFAPVGSGRGFLSPFGRKSSRGCGAGRWARRGRGFGAPHGAPSSREHPSGWSGSATHKQHVHGCGIAAKTRSLSVCSSPFLCLCLFSRLLLKIRRFSKPLLRVSSLRALAGPGVFRCGTTCSLLSAVRWSCLRAGLGTPWVGFSLGRSEAVQVRVKQRSFCKRDHSNSPPPLERSFCWENNLNCKIVFI